MNLFNQSYHIQVYMHKLQLEKKKKKIVGCKRGFMEQGQNLDFNLRGPKHEPKYFLTTWGFIKLKIMVGKKFHFIT